MDVISRQVLDLWNRYKPTIAVDAIEYDGELKKLLGTNLAEVGTDCISRQQAIVTAVNAAINWHKLANPQYSIAYCIGEAMRQLPPIQPEITHEQAIDYLHSTGWMQEHDRQMMLDGVRKLTIQPEPHEIGYDDCASALLKMWMDNVLTDGDYYRIADKLNKKWGKTELPEPYEGVSK